MTAALNLVDLGTTSFQHALPPRRHRSLSRDDARRLGISVASSIDTFACPGPAALGPIGVVDLFSGCGGLSLGFEAVGRAIPSYRLLAAAEIDEHAASTYGINLPVRPLQLDLAEVASSRKRIERFAEQTGVADRSGPWILVGGPPCQGFSSHRKKSAEKQDIRNDLVAAFGRIAAKLQPDFVVLENVPELLSAQHWPNYLAFKKQLERSGYHVRAAIHNLAGYGVPQERFRALVLASRNPFHLPIPFLTSAEYRTVRDAIGELPRVAAGERLTSDPMHCSSKHRAETIKILRRIPHDGGRRPKGIGPRCLDKVDGFRDVYGRMFWDRPANTITAFSRNPASGRYVHPDQDRALTIREAALLQSFPRHFMFSGPFDHRFLQVGNAVPPAFAAYLAAHLLGEFNSRSRGPTTSDEITSPLTKSFSSSIAAKKTAR